VPELESGVVLRDRVTEMDFSVYEVLFFLQAGFGSGISSFWPSFPLPYLDIYAFVLGRLVSLPYLYISIFAISS